VLSAELTFRCSLIFETIMYANDFNFLFAVAFFAVMLPILLTSSAFTNETGKSAAYRPVLHA
jgi:hypothetical protein